MEIDKLKQKILDLAIRGKLVPQDPDDEPASVLIERIREEKEKLIKEGKIKRDKNESYIYRGSDNYYYEKIGNVIKDITDEIPFEVPKTWEWIRIGNYAHIITDYVASGSFASLNENVKYYKEENYAILLRTCDFKGNFNNGLVYTDEHGYNFLKNSNLYGGEVLLSNIGASIGKVFIVPKLNKKMTLAPNSIMVNTYNDILNLFIYNVFLSTPYQNKLQNISASSAQAKFNKTDFRKIIIPVPPLNEQRNVCNKIRELLEFANCIKTEKMSIKELIKTLKTQILEYYFGENSCYKSYYENNYTLGDILTYEQPGPFIVKSTDYNDKYNIPVLTPGKTFILGYTNEKAGIYNVKNSKVIIFDDFTTASKLVDFDFKVKSSAMKILSSSNTNLFDIDYMYFLIQTINVISDTHKRYWISEYMPMKLKIHTIGQQKKIVNKINQLFTILNSMSNSI